MRKIQILIFFIVLHFWQFLLILKIWSSFSNWNLVRTNLKRKNYLFVTNWHFLTLWQRRSQGDIWEPEPMTIRSETGQHTASIENSSMQFRICESSGTRKNIDDSLIFLAKNWRSVYFPHFRNSYFEGYLNLGISILRDPSFWEFLFWGIPQK